MGREKQEEGTPWKEPERYDGDYTEEEDNFNLADEVRRVLGVQPGAMNKIAKRFVAHYKILTTAEDKGEALGMYFLEINQWRP